MQHVIYLTHTLISCIVKNINNLNKGQLKMINYNLILYIGIALIVFGFILFIISQIKLRQLEIEEFNQQQLSKSFFKSQKDMNKWAKKNNNKMIKAIGKLK